MASPSNDKKSKEVKKKLDHDGKSTLENDIKLSLPSFRKLLLECLTLLNLGVISHDNRIIGRMLRRVSTLRQLFQPDVFSEFVRALLLPTNPKRAELLLEKLCDVYPPKRCLIPSKNKDIEMVDVNGEKKTAGTTTSDDVVMNAAEEIAAEPLVGICKEFEQSSGDVDVFLTTLGMMLLIDNRDTKTAILLASSMVDTLSEYPPKYKYEGLIVGKAIFYTARVYELEGQFTSLRGFLMEIYRTSVLHRQTTPQAIALNMLLRNLLQQNLYDQAVKFLEKAPYPEELRSNAQHARYLYYLARINAVRLDYGEAYSKVIQAIRKAPQEGAPFGRGFRSATHKLCCVIQLLMGEIPDRQLFNQKDIRRELELYARIVQAVRSGDLASFKRLTEEYESTFVNDGNFDLIQRLHYNVLRAGLKRISSSYSVISLSDIALKLGLESTHDTECIVSKAIADGVIDAVIDFETNTVRNKTQSEHPITDAPRKAFHGRIAFCLQLHNEAVKAMQYPEAESQTKIEEAEAKRKEHQEQLARAEKDEFGSGDDGDLI